MLPLHPNLGIPNLDRIYRMNRIIISIILQILFVLSKIYFF